MTKVITLAEWEEYIEFEYGFCTHCQEFTSDYVGKDYEFYECDKCQKRTVYGAEKAVVRGVILVKPW